jgi:hypothetical protein
LVFFAWVYSDQDGTWHRVASSERKARAEEYLAVCLDSRRLPVTHGIVLVAGRRPIHTPQGKLLPEKTVNPTERGPDFYRDSKQK